MRISLLGRFLVLLLLLLPARADGNGGSLDRLLPEIRRHNPGALMDAEGPYRGPDQVMRYRIKWMTAQGRLMWFEVDARNGHILGMVTGTMPQRDIWQGDLAGPYPPSLPPDAPPSSASREERTRHRNDWARPTGEARDRRRGDWGRPSADERSHRRDDSHRSRRNRN